MALQPRNKLALQQVRHYPARRARMMRVAPRSAQRLTALARARAVEVTAIKEASATSTAVKGDAELSRSYQTADAVELPAELDAKLKAFFDKMDTDSNGEVSKTEAIAFWGKNFAKVNAQSMFNEVDADGNEAISWEEFRKFWQNVVGSGYSVDDLMEEVDMMLEGGSWVDFDDGRTT